MVHPSKAKGSKYERDLASYLISNGVDYERLRQVGIEDEGDGVVRNYGEHSSRFLVVEAKAENRIDLPGYLRELEREEKFFSQHRGIERSRVNGIVVIKRRMASVGDSFVVTTVDKYFGIKGE